MIFKKYLNILIITEPIIGTVCFSSNFYKMILMYRLAFPILFIFFLSSCMESNPNLNEAGQDIIEAKEMYSDVKDLPFRDTVYVPIYSDIYSETKDYRMNLTATLSIRNTSLFDPIYVEAIDYYDTNGTLVHRYLERTILLKAMQSIEYVIEEDDVKGGTGANFIVNWGALTGDVKPIFQGVMISTSGQQGLSFVTEGVSISRK